MPLLRLFDAIENDDLSFLESQLLKLPDLLNTPSSIYPNDTLLMKSFQLNKPLFIDLLLRLKADITKRNTKHYTALTYAIENCSFEYCERLLQLNSNLASLSINHSWSPFYSAVLRNSPILIKMLHTHHSELETKNETGLTALLLAVQYRKLEAAKALIQLNANINAKDIKDRSSLWYAIRNSDTKMLELLLQYRANIDKQTRSLSRNSILAIKNRIAYQDYLAGYAPGIVNLIDRNSPMFNWIFLIERIRSQSSSFPNSFHSKDN